MRRRAAAAALGIVALLAIGLAGNWASGSSSLASPRAFSSEHHAYDGSLPPGWQRSATRLVPLLMPREILTAGTAPMPSGGGGNCGREPVAAVGRMRPGDALVTIQEYAVTPKMRARTGANHGPPTLAAALPELDLRREAIPGGGSSRSAGGLWSSTIWFRDGGRWFDALVYLRGAPSATRLGQVRALLAGLRFGQARRGEVG